METKQEGRNQDPLRTCLLCSQPGQTHYLRNNDSHLIAHTRTMSQALFSLTSFRTTLPGRNYDLHYVNEKTEAWGGKTTCPRSHSMRSV